MCGCCFVPFREDEEEAAEAGGEREEGARASGQRAAGPEQEQAAEDDLALSA